MTFLPIVARELRRTSRKAKTYWGRTGIAAAMLAVAGWVFVMFHRQTPSDQALALFGTLTGALLLVGGFSGMASTADALSSEKREGTLGLLFLTPLRGYDVVFGKLVTGSLDVLYGLLGAMPIMALPVLLGGVSGAEFGRMALLLMNTMLLSLSIGIAVSSISRDEKRARGVALLVMILLAGGFPVAAAWMDVQTPFHGLGRSLLFFSPGYAFAAAWDRTRGIPPWGFWISMSVIHLSTWFFLGLACWFTPRTWQDRSAEKRSRLVVLLRAFTGGDRSAGPAFRTRLLDRNAFYWLSARPQYKGLLVWAVLIGVTAVWLGLGIRYPRDMFDTSMFVVMALTWNGIVKVWVASESTRQIALDRRAGSIELLLSTPLTVRDITNGLWLSLKRQFGGPLLAVLFAECLLLVIGAREVGRGEQRLVWVAVWGCGIVMLLADLLALYAVGLWQSAVAKAPAQAAGATAFRILALPWILFMALGAVVAMADGLRIIRGVPDPEWAFWLGGWTLIGFGVDLLFGLGAWRAVHSQFREVASQRSAARGWGGALGRSFGRIKAGLTVNR